MLASNHTSIRETIGAALETNLQLLTEILDEPDNSAFRDLESDPANPIPVVFEAAEASVMLILLDFFLKMEAIWMPQ